jgi:hypothetical protein
MKKKLPMLDSALQQAPVRSSPNSRAMHLFEVLATRDALAVAAIVTPAFEKAAQEASDRAHRRGIHVADGRIGEGGKK